MRLVPRAATMLIGQSIDDLRDASGGRLVDDRTDDRSRYNCRGCDCGSDCNRVVTAATTVIAAATVVPAAMVVGIYVDVAIYVDVRIAVHVDVVVSVHVVIPVLVLVVAAAWGRVDAGSSAGAGTATATTARAAATAASALSGKCHSRYQDGDGEDGEELS